MGNFWGSVHLRTDDRAAVIDAVTSLAAQRKLKFYVGPAYRGWVAVYPHDSGQDEAVARAIVVETSLVKQAFHVMLHDDDVFAYNFYRDGQLVDEYTSRPGYFSEKDRVAEQRLSGHPQLYADISIAPQQKIAELLRRDDDPAAKAKYIFENERMSEFAKLVGLTNVETSYEYLAEGEAQGVKGWRQFVHVPPVSQAREDRRRHSAELQLQINSLKADGALLAAYTGRKQQWPIWCVDYTSGNAFLIKWNDARSPTPTTELSRVAPPWPKTA